MSLRYTAPYFEWIDGDGVPAAGWKLYFYTTGTTTPLATYSDSTLTTPNANPVIANADGYWGAIFLQAAQYKVVLKTDADVQEWSADPVSGTGGGGGQSSNIRTTTISSAITINDGTVIVNAAGATTQTLPSAASASGLIFTIKNINVGAATVAGTIDGTTNYILNFLNQSVTVQSDGISYISM